jgi:hypothetical protein
VAVDDVMGSPRFWFIGHEDLMEEHFKFGTVHDCDEMGRVPAGYVLTIKDQVTGKVHKMTGAATYGDLAYGNLVKEVPDA